MVVARLPCLFNPFDCKTMVEQRIAGHKVRMYESIDELPIVRFQKFQKYLLIDAGVGGDIASFDQRCEKIRRYLGEKKDDLAAQEMENLRQCVNLIQMEVNPGHRAFACLVESIDGERTDDLSDNGLARVMERLGGMTMKEAATIARAVKKKIDAELGIYFPNLFGASDTKEYYDLLKKRALAILEGLSRGELVDVDKLTTAIICFSKPRQYSGTHGAEVEFDRNFETICISLSENLGMKPKSCTTLEFYNAVELLQERARKAERGRK